jgi:hypothetical protein
MNASYGKMGQSAADDEIKAQVQACKTIADDENRLNCFDQISLHPASSKEPEKSQQNHDKDSIEPSQGLSTPSLNEDEFGAESLRARIEEKEKQTPQKIEVSLIEVGKNRLGKFFFVLSNGQVWRQLKADTQSVVIPRDLSDSKVKIRKKLLGGYLLTLDGRSVRVKRIR